jgi:ABC-type uncharacterized transport system permease subunit
VRRDAGVQLILIGDWSLPLRETEATNALIDAGCGVTGHAHGPKGVIGSLPRVNDIAVGMATMSLGDGLASSFAMPCIQASASRIQRIDFGFRAQNPSPSWALQIDPLVFVGVALATFLWRVFANTHPGLFLRMAGDSEPSARAMGVNPIRRRLLATVLKGSVAPSCRCRTPVSGPRGFRRGRG